MKEIKPFKKLPVDNLFRYEVEKIEMAYRISGVLHKDASDIKAGGNEIELCVREFFAQKLTSKFYVTNGHIIDSSTAISPQFDIIIADNSKSPILYKSKDDTNILTYESIYSIGEVKRSWYVSKGKYPFEIFFKTIKRTKKELNRKEVKPYVIDGISDFESSQKTTRFPFKNPLFNFLFIVESSKFNLTHIEDLCSDYNNWEFLPNLTLLLDQGVLVNINTKELNENNNILINLYPEFVNKEDNEWVFISLKERQQCLAYFYLILLQHLNACTLSPPNLMDYLQEMFPISKNDITLLT